MYKWYIGRWWVGCYILYSEEGCGPAQPFAFGRYGAFSVSAVYLQQFPSYSNDNYKKSAFYVPRPSLFVCPGDAPVAMTQNVAWMIRQFSACQTPRSMCPSIFNSFPVIQTASAKNRRFHVPQPTFLFPQGLEMPLRLSRNLLHRWKDNSMLAKPHTACTIYLQQFPSFEPQVQKIAVFTYRSTHFCFHWRRSCDFHAICCMDGKTIQCLPNPSQRILIYIQ